MSSWGNDLRVSDFRLPAKQVMPLPPQDPTQATWYKRYNTAALSNAMSMLNIRNL